MHSSTYGANQGCAALESLLHEVCHTTSLELHRYGVIYEAFKRQQATVPRDLYHAFVFYTVGELTRAVTVEEGSQEYQTQAERFGFYQRERWSGFREAFDKHWRPMLRGEIDQLTALDRIVGHVSRQDQ